MNNLNPENVLKNSIDSITIETSKKITKQMKHCICKIKNDEKIGVGFFCNINLDDNFKCHTLITSYNMFNEDDIKRNQILNIYFNDDKDHKSIKLDDNRRIYFNENFGIRILIIENNDYLDLDDNLLDNDFSYENRSLYILQYQNNNKASVSFGKLKDIKESIIFHLCKVENCSDGSPILNLSNNKVIGIQNNPQNSGFNCGTFLKSPIKEMIDMKEKFKNNKIIKKKKILKIENSFQISLNKNPMNNHMQNQNQINDNIYPMNNINNMNNNNNQIINQIPFNLNNMNMNMGLFGQNNLDFGMMMNNNMNIGNPIPNNMGFNMNNNNLINNMHMFNNNIGLNQVNINNINNNQNNINQQKININDKYINKLRKNSPKKINVTFNYQERNLFIVDHGTTIGEMLLNYLKFSGMFYISECITFLYNSTRLNLDDKRPVEVACSYNYDMRISVSVSDIVVIKKFFFETTSGVTLNVLFDSYSTIEELFEAFFNEVGSPELFGKNNNIIFIYNGLRVKYNEKEIIDSLFTNNNNNVVVTDMNYLIRGNLHL